MKKTYTRTLMIRDLSEALVKLYVSEKKQNLKVMKKISKNNDRWNQELVNNLMAKMQKK